MAFLGAIAEGLEGLGGFIGAAEESGPLTTGFSLYEAEKNLGAKRKYADLQSETGYRTPQRPIRREPPQRPSRPSAPPRPPARVVPSREMFNWLDLPTRQKIARVRRANWKQRHYRKSSFYRKWSAARKIQRAFRKNYYRFPKRSSYAKFAKYTRPKFIQPRPYWNYDFTRKIYPDPFWDTSIGEPYGKLKRYHRRTDRVRFRRYRRDKEWRL